MSWEIDPIFSQKIYEAESSFFKRLKLRCKKTLLLYRVKNQICLKKIVRRFTLDQASEKSLVQ